MSNIPEYKNILEEAKKHCDDKDSRGDANLMHQCVSNVLRAMRIEMELCKMEHGMKIKGDVRVYKPRF
jgi:hypothetical protein